MAALFVDWFFDGISVKRKDGFYNIKIRSNELGSENYEMPLRSGPHNALRAIPKPPLEVPVP
jgi:hypothetical protein